MRKFVLGDIHGAYLALIQCLERAGFDHGSDVLVQLGDVADGFPQVFECVEELLKIESLIAIRGNHDDWFAEFLHTGYQPNNWNHGGKGTLISYLNLAGKNGLYVQRGNGIKTGLVPEDVPKSHLDFFYGQHPFYVDGDNRCFVHGGFDPKRKIEGQEPSFLFMDRTLLNDAIAYRQSKKVLENENGFTEIFLGHTPTQNWGSDVPINVSNIFNIDTGAGHQGRLTIMEMETKEYWQSDPVGELYPGYAGR